MKTASIETIIALIQKRIDKTMGYHRPESYGDLNWDAVAHEMEYLIEDIEGHEWPDLFFESKAKIKELGQQVNSCRNEMNRFMRERDEQVQRAERAEAEIKRLRDERRIPPEKKESTE